MATAGRRRNAIRGCEERSRRAARRSRPSNDDVENATMIHLLFAGWKMSSHPRNSRHH